MGYLFPKRNFGSSSKTKKNHFCSNISLPLSRISLPKLKTLDLNFIPQSLPHSHFLLNLTITHYRAVHHLFPQSHSIAELTTISLNRKISVPTISISIAVTTLTYHYPSVRFTLEYHSQSHNFNQLLFYWLVS